jgi:hypothetical protein
VSNSAAIAAFCVIAAVLLTLISYMLYRRALEMGHEAGRVARRLALFWIGCLLALALGMYFKHLYPEGALTVNFGGAGRGTAAAALVGMAAGVVIAWLAVRPLQVPPPGGPEGPD